METMLNIALGGFVRKVEKMNGARCMGDVDNDVADLAEAVSAAIKAEELGDCICRMSYVFSRRHMGRKGRVRGFVFQKSAEEMDEEELKEHAGTCY